MKRLCAVILAMGMILLLLAACGGTAPSAPTASASVPAPGSTTSTVEASEAPAPGAEAPQKIAFLCPGSINDSGFNSLIYNSMLNLEEKYGIEFSYKENATTSEYEEIFRSFAQAGFDLIIGHGNASADPAMIVAEDYPDIKFLCTSSTASNGTNMGSVSVAGYEEGFLQGVVAGLVTKTNKVGAIGIEIASIKKVLWGFEAGAKYVNPDVEVSTVYLTDSSDSSGAQQAASSLYSSGFDVVLQNCDPAGNSIYSVAAEYGGLAIATCGDHTELAPDVILFNGLEDYPSTVESIYLKMADGTWEPTAYSIGIQDGSVSYAFNEELASQRMTKEQRDEFDSIYQDVLDGKLDLKKIVEEALDVSVS